MTWEDERVSVLGVAKKWLPWHVGVFTLSVFGILGYSIGVNWREPEKMVLLYSQILNKGIPTIVMTQIAVEGFIMGAIALWVKLRRQKEIEAAELRGEQRGQQRGQQRGERKGIEESIRLLERSGNPEGAKILRERASR